ncbi:hypothetical protein [Salipiger bermudensis]|uniref:hypothetical protein n=1 Tax=Salipiger bermudensis TaxID=344736 RepID=UPI001CD50B92|nr:hypothetical protein [Salipiger bermudensis]MCA1288659.1 hypothetical protein [Salipiger bermudensis]
MKLYVFEGTVDELSEVSAKLGLGSTTTVGAAPEPKEEAAQVFSSANDGDEPVSVTFASRVLKRRGVSDAMLSVLAALFEAGDEMLGIEKLCEASGYTRPQFAGLMGAFGRRISHTEGYDPETYFFKTEWNDETHEWTYGLPESVRAALVKEALV